MFSLLKSPYQLDSVFYWEVLKHAIHTYPARIYYRFIPRTMEHIRRARFSEVKNLLSLLLSMSLDCQSYCLVALKFLSYQVLVSSLVD